MASSTKTPVSALQELMVAKKLPLPTYFDEPCIGGLQFKCTVHAGGVTAVGFGTTKKAAKQESAKNALARLESPSRLLVVEEVQKNYVGNLNEYATRKQLPYPDYNVIQTANPAICSCNFWGRKSLGRGDHRKDAKQDSAKNMLKLLYAEEESAGKVAENLMDGPDLDKLASMYDKLTIHSISLQNPKPNRTIPEITFVEEESVDELMAKLRAQGVDFTIRVIQSNPYVLSLTVKDTKHVFVERGETREGTLRKLLQNVILVSKDGVSLTSDLISL